jgi:hypothetical protein
MRVQQDDRSGAVPALATREMHDQIARPGSFDEFMCACGQRDTTHLSVDGTSLFEVGRAARTRFATNRRNTQHMSLSCGQSPGPPLRRTICIAVADAANQIERSGV